MGVLVAIAGCMVHFLAPQAVPSVSMWAAFVTMLLTAVNAFPQFENLLQRRRGRSAAVMVPRQLPGSDNHFIGRKNEMAKLDALRNVRGLAAKIAVVSGTAGVGKTACVVHWAHRVRHRFTDGDLYADLRGYGSEDRVCPGEVLDDFLRVLGVPDEELPPSLPGKEAKYRDLMHDRRVLVVLDNAFNAEQVRPLLPGSPDSLVVVTSRNRLDDLSIGLGVSRVCIEPLPEPDAIELLGRVVGAQVGDDPTTANLAWAGGYLPLALRIVAARAVMRPNGIGELAEELAQAPHRLDLLSVPGYEACNLRRLFSWSCQMLSPDALAMFRILGLYTGPDIGVTAAAGLAGISTSRARQQLELLAREHLVVTLPDNRYRLYDLLHAYAAERAGEKDV